MFLIRKENTTGTHSRPEFGGDIWMSVHQAEKDLDLHGGLTSETVEQD